MGAVAALAFSIAALSASAATANPAVQFNDNLRAAGHVDSSGLVVRLVAAEGVWHPEGPEGAPRDAAAFGEEGGALSTPGPLIKVPAGTAVTVTLHNTLAYDLTVHGLCDRPGPCHESTVRAGTTVTIPFRLKAPGTYTYWAARGADTIETRLAADSQLGGAIVVDPPGVVARDRIFVVSVFTDPHSDDPSTPFVPTINGRSWPFTERLHYQVGDRVRFRVVDLSFEPHAMHLHGFHFELEATGDGTISRTFPPGRRRLGVTEYIDPNGTFAMSWTATRPGNWLFHCHMVTHITPDPPVPPTHADHMASDASSGGMAGLVMGIIVSGAASPETPSAMPPDRATMTIDLDANRYGAHPGYRVEFPGRNAPRLDKGPVPGPVLVVERGRPTEITVENHLLEPTAIHWHGIEIESYYDGVPGFGGVAGSVTPAIAPGGSFVAKFTPPRAGTFIYHTHWHDSAQLAGGLYGALIVVEPGARFDPETDHVALIGLSGIDEPGPEPFVLNGRPRPAPIRLRAGVVNRLRLINITLNDVDLVVRLVDAGNLSRWKPLARDGATLPAWAQVLGPARQLVTVGQTYDVEIPASAPRKLWLEVRESDGYWVIQAPVVVAERKAEKPPRPVAVPLPAGAPPSPSGADRLPVAAVERFAALALSCVHQEYPNKVAHVLQSDADIAAPRGLTPAFYGCYDWHSAVHGHWLLARLARLYPDAPFAAKARDALAESLTPERIAGEVHYLEGKGRVSFERPYGLAWLLQLHAELAEWKDPQAHAWAAALDPLAHLAAARLTDWLPKLTRPIRIGEHDQTAFALGLALDWARGVGKSADAEAFATAVRRFYLDDRACPLTYEPSGEDFLSPCLAEADLVGRILPADDFARWLDGFLPTLPRDGGGDWLEPGIVTDPSDPKLAHLDGLNLSRAWMLEGMAARLPATDTRRAGLLAAAHRHRAAALPDVTGEHYEGGHWLGTFATYLVTGRGLPQATR